MGSEMDEPHNGSSVGDELLLEQLRDPAFDGRVLIKGAAIVPMDREVGDLERGDILLHRSTIEAVGADLSGSIGAGGTIVVEAAGCIAIPGLQDAHRHAWQTQIRRLLGDGGFSEYLATTHFGLGPHYRPEDIYIANRVAGLTALDQGITTVLDFSHNCRTPEHTSAALDAWKDTGTRTVFVPAQPIGGRWPDGRWREHLQALRQGELSSDDRLIGLRMGVYTRAIPDVVVGDIALDAANAAFARELGLAITCDAVFGRHSSVHIEELAEQGVLGPDMTFIHCQTIGEGAWRALAEAGCRVSLAATSDAQLGCEEAVPPIQQALDHGVVPALSVDVECALSSDLFTQMRVVLNVQRMQTYRRHQQGEVEEATPISVRDALEYATIAGARANGVDDRTGSLTPGKQADLVLIRADDVSNMPLNNATGTVVLGTDPHNIDKVFVAGRPKKWNRQLVDVDPQALHRTIIDSRDYLLERTGRNLHVV
jgi:cytosine/adenosine deaminase-related metal-dependent hydrolase